MTKSVKTNTTKVIFALLAFWLFLSCPGMFAHAQEVNVADRNVLILNSYHYGYTWSDDETRGILETLESSGLRIYTFIDFLDWKNNPSEENIQNIYNNMKIKYKNKKIDMIITMDDKALEFALKHRAEIFDGAPVVFCGVNEEALPQLMNGEKKVTGVVEDNDSRDTIAAALHIHPGIKKIYTIYDNSESGLLTGKQMASYIHEVRPDIAVENLERFTLDEIFEKVGKVEEDSIILISVYVNDVNGRSVLPEYFCKKVSSVSPVPVYHNYSYALGNGTVGGSLIDGYKHGRLAAMMALRVLKGEDIAAIPVSNDKSSSLIFDYNQLQRFHIKNKQLPAGSKVINLPFSFIETYAQLVTVVVVAFCVLLVFIVLLLVNSRRRKIAEKALKVSHSQLTGLFIEQAAAKETLQQQFEEIDRKRELLEKSEQRYALASEGSNDIIWDYDTTIKKIYLSPKWYELLNHPLAKDTGGHLYIEMSEMKEYIHPEDYKIIGMDNIVTEAIQNSFFSREFRVRDANGNYHWFLLRGKALYDRDGKIMHMAGSMTDITERKINEQKINRMAYYDALTGLPNRVMIQKVFDEFIQNADKSSEPRIAIAMMDIDKFKEFNDYYGHGFGDEVLIEVASRLQATAGDNTMVGRMGGDEFVILFMDISSKTELINRMERIKSSFGRSMLIEQINVYLSLSMGATNIVRNDITFREIIRNADTALYQAKRQGRGQYILYSCSMDDDLNKRIELERELEQAYRENQFIVYYQPLMDLGANQICGAEALIRWNHPTKGMILPSEFMALSEETSLILPIGEWVLSEACRFAAKMKAISSIFRFVSVNVSDVQIRQSGFADMVLKCVQEAGISGNMLVLELTGHAVNESMERYLAKIEQLKMAGIQIYMDNFGQNSDFLNSIRFSSPDALKLDKVLICNVDTQARVGVLVKHMIELAHLFGKYVVAVGVEEDEQVNMLKNSGCDMIQGYRVARPMSEEEIYQFFLP